MIWRRELGSPLQAAPAPAGDRVYLPLKDGRIVAVSIQTGEEIWTRKLAEAAVGILPVGDRLFVGGARQPPALRWTRRMATATGAGAPAPTCSACPVLDQKRVYFVALDNVLRGHDRNSGSMLWKQVLPMRPFTGPLLSGETLDRVRAWRARCAPTTRPTASRPERSRAQRSRKRRDCSSPRRPT